MHFIRVLSSCIVFTLWSVTVLCNDSIGGLIFRAYDYSKDERTSLIIPSSDQKIDFENYLSLSFDLKIRSQGEHFGYVCRIIIGNQSNINLILVNPVNEDPYLCFIKDQQYLGKIRHEKAINIHEWNTIKIELEIKDNSWYIKENGIVIAQDEKIPENHSVKVCFGANELANFSTSDVAPMLLKNVKLGLNDKKTEYLWTLEQPASSTLIKAQNSGLTASVVNPEWIISQHLHWKHLRTLSFTSKTYSVPDRDSGVVYFVSKNNITRFDLVSNTIKEYAFSTSIDVDRLSNQFIVLPDTTAEKRRLVYYDFEKEDIEVLSFFDFETRTWSVPIKRTRQSIYSQHNKFFSKRDSSIIQLFGYGFHKYISEVNRVSLSGKVVRSKLPEMLPPRYLSSVGVTDSVVYIYGGLGNELGKQEYGVNNYRDLYKLSLNDYSFKKLWSMDSESCNEVAAPSLMIDSKEEYAKGLFFTPLRFLSGLVLKELNLATGELTALGDTIPYYFLDVSSSAELMYLPAQQTYYAVTVHQSEGHNYEANVYSISAPVLPLPTETIGKASLWLLYIVSAGVVLIIGVFVIGRFRKSGKPIKVATNQSLETEVLMEEKVMEPHVLASKSEEFSGTNTTPGVYLLNGFQVIDKDSKDITGKFTPIMRQLLSVIILYSNRNHKGISNIKLKELLWFDKSEESFSNNRSVNMRKIRLLLEDVGKIEISSENGYWYFFNKEQVYIDYVTAIELIEKVTPLNRIDEKDLKVLLRIASFGQLLPNLQFDWMDEFKADYSDSMINLLSKLRDSEQFEQEDKAKLAISNCTLKFDSLDEDSVRVKCRSLINLKRSGVAHAAFEQFTKEYKLILNESYKDSFEQFIRDEEE